MAMDYMIFDSSGNALGAYDDVVAAAVALRRIAEEHPTDCDVAMVPYSAGMPAGKAVHAAELPIGTTSVSPSPWTPRLTFVAACKEINESFRIGYPLTLNPVAGR